MISKELLSEVLPNTERYIYKLVDGNPIRVDHKWQGVVGTLNLYELAHLCKEWALDKKYNLLSYLSDREDKEEGYVQVYSRDGFKKTIYGETEPEAIFKACEWILKDIDE